MMHTIDHIEKAREETKKALKYQSKARKVSLSCGLPASNQQLPGWLMLSASASLFSSGVPLPLQGSHD